jgi:NTP pyrophosphatase (non-canonical NTP hydrolase)
MDFSEYQKRAALTDQVTDEDKRLVVPLLGMAGEVGSFLVQYKKFLCDGPSHKLFKEQFPEELGDLLWYLSSLATKMDITLDDVAQKNLTKVADRWPLKGEIFKRTKPHYFDEHYSEEE